MTKKPKPEPEDKEQSQRFIDTARELKSDESGEPFEKAISSTISNKKIDFDKNVKSTKPRSC